MLANTDRAILNLESRRWKYAGAKHTAIHDELGMSATRYYQALNALLDDPAALAEYPVQVRRLQRLRDLRRQQRANARMPA